MVYKCDLGVKGLKFSCVFSNHTGATEIRITAPGEGNVNLSAVFTMHDPFMIHPNLPSCLLVLFHHLKLEFLKRFPASDDGNIYIF